MFPVGVHTHFIFVCYTRGDVLGVASSTIQSTDQHDDSGEKTKEDIVQPSQTIIDVASDPGVPKCSSEMQALFAQL